MSLSKRDISRVDYFYNLHLVLLDEKFVLRLIIKKNQPGLDKISANYSFDENSPYRQKRGFFNRAGLGGSSFGYNSVFKLRPSDDENNLVYEYPLPLYNQENVIDCPACMVMASQELFCKACDNTKIISFGIKQAILNIAMSIDLLSCQYNVDKDDFPGEVAKEQLWFFSDVPLEGFEVYLTAPIVAYLDYLSKNQPALATTIEDLKTVVSKLLGRDLLDFKLNYYSNKIHMQISEFPNESGMYSPPNQRDDFGILLKPGKLQSLAHQFAFEAIFARLAYLTEEYQASLAQPKAV